MIDALRTLLAPGGRSRISPYVQDAQLQVLFGESPDAHDRQRSLRAILQRHDFDVRKIAETFVSFRKDGLPFTPNTYASEPFLRFYLAYYFTTNVPKVQLCLLDLVDKEKIGEVLTVVDIGVGSGTTAVAVLDFLLAWSTACRLFDRPFPVKSLRLQCYDSSPTCLGFAENVVAALCQAMDRRRASTSAQDGVPADGDRIVAWGRSADWRHHDLARAPVVHGGDSQVILFASNVLNELTQGGQKSLATSIDTMPPGSIAAIIEPGDKKRCCTLNGWKTQLQLGSNLRCVAPCGDEGLGDMSRCSSCWNSRREAIQEPLLYRSLRERVGDRRSFDEHSNTLLSWSYAVLEPESSAHDRPLATPGRDLTTRVLGTFRQQDQKNYEQVRLGPDEHGPRDVREWLKLCPATMGKPGAKSLLAQRQPGFVLPWLPHGAAIRIRNAKLEENPAAKNRDGWMIVLDHGIEIQPLVAMTSTTGFLSAYGASAREAVDEVAFRLFGFQGMRPFQHEILGRVLTGSCILGIAATGGGKSECYILPAMLFSGVTIVISPLKSLMQDQLEKRIDERYGLRDLATFINGDVLFSERQARLKRMELGYYKLVYFTPEHSSDPGAAIVFMPWAGDPDNPESHLRERDAYAGAKGRNSAHVSFFGSYLERSLGTRVAIYHSKMDFDRIDDEAKAAGQDENHLGDLSGRTRRSEQDSFMEGQCAIMVATKGFGMGIDKPNIRLIIHRTPTANLEAYAQEAGRAGRDGKVSDVVLYYSPDEGEDDGMSVSRDYDIQNFFLLEKYIRREDVIAMRTFLATVNRGVVGHLYFTSDEILPFFDELAKRGLYAWPDFQPRRERDGEWGRHAAILGRGRLYNEKVGYIGRILSALYRIRPDIGSKRRVSLLESVQKVGARLIDRDGSPVVLDAARIVGSNAYFGQLLRDRGVDPVAFSTWIERCIEDDTLAFAGALGLTVGETASILWDMNRSDGEFKGRNRKWRSKLLEFLYIAAPKYGKTRHLSPSAWRDYAGAKSRASRPEARKRAQQARSRGEHRDVDPDGTPKPTEDDWFGPHELPEPTGWEVRLGLALVDAQLFERYVSAFMEVHDRRKDNDRAAYRLLLTDYVGVNENGSLPTREGKKPCLRAVLLGYLKTGEVVQGNCGSCSRCVPDGDYEQDLTKRAKAVERLGTEVKDLLDALEGSPSRIPAVAELQTLWQHVEAQERAGRSLRAYVEGWTGRLLTDSPGHKAAACVRVDGMVRGKLPLQPQEVCARADALLKSADERALAGLWETLSLLGAAVPDAPESVLIRAVACQRMGRFDASRALWLELLDRPISREMQHQSHAALTALFDPQGPCPDTTRFPRHAIEAARTAADAETGTSFYARVRRVWSWAEIRPEILYRRDRERTDSYCKGLAESWVMCLSDLRRLAQKPMPADWAGLVGTALGWIEEEKQVAPDLAGLLRGAIDTWARRILSDKPDLSPVRALRIGLLAAGGTGNHEELASACLEFLNHADDEQRNWLSAQLQSSRLDLGHPPTRYILGELAFRQGDYGAADAYWRTFLDGLPSEVASPHLSRVLSRLCDLHRPQGPMPDAACLEATLLLRERIAHSDEEKWELSRERISGWSAARLPEEIRSHAESSEPASALHLLARWTELHPRADGSEVALSLLQWVPQAVLDANATLVIRLLDDVNPLMVADDPVFGRRYLDAVLKSIADRGHLGDQERRSVIPRHLPTSQLEFLVCAALTGPLASDSAARSWLPQVVFADVFAEASASMDSDLAVRFAPVARKRIVSGCDDEFLRYQPESSRELDRWLLWFGAMLLESDAFASRVIVVIKKVLHKALAVDRSEVREFVSVCEKHGIQEHVPDFPLFKAFVDAVRRVEMVPGIARAREPSAEQIAAVIRTFDACGDDLHADILVAILRFIRGRMNRSWGPPMNSRLAEALVNAGRLDEAEAEARAVQGRMARPGELSVWDLIVGHKGPQRGAPPYDPLLIHLAELFLKSWSFV